MDLADKTLIREIKAEDLDRISKIQESITQKSVDIDFKKVVEDVAQNNKEAAFVAELEGEVVGYMISYILLGCFGRCRRSNFWNFDFCLVGKTQKSATTRF